MAKIVDIIKDIVSQAAESVNTDIVEENTVKVIQWTGDNFEDLEKVIKHYLTGYAYRKDDDVLIDYNDGMSIKRMKPLDWILVNDSDNDIAVMTDKMFKLIWKSLKSSVKSQIAEDEEKAKVDSQNPETRDDGVNISIDDQYGNHIIVKSPYFLSNNHKADYFVYDSTYGDHLDIVYDWQNYKIDLSMKDRYGNRIKVNGTQLKSEIKSGQARTGAQLFDKLKGMLDEVQAKTLKQLAKMDSVLMKAKDKAI